MRDFRAAVVASAKPTKPPGEGEIGLLGEALADAEAKLAARNADIRQLRADLVALAARVVFLSQENAPAR